MKTDENKVENKDESCWFEIIKFWADYNDISEKIIPRNKDELSKVEELSLKHSTFEKIPKEFENLKNLKRIYIGKKNAYPLDKSLLEMKNLKDLKIFIY